MMIAPIIHKADSLDEKSVSFLFSLSNSSKYSAYFSIDISLSSSVTSAEMKSDITYAITIGTSITSGSSEFGKTNILSNRHIIVNKTPASLTFKDMLNLSKIFSLSIFDILIRLAPAYHFNGRLSTAYAFIREIFLLKWNTS